MFKLYNTLIGEMRVTGKGGGHTDVKLIAYASDWALWKHVALRATKCFNKIVFILCFLCE